MFNPFSKFKSKKVAHPVKGRLIHSERDYFGLIQVIDTDTTRSLYFDSPVEQGRMYFEAPMTLAFEYQQLMLDMLDDFSQKNRVEKTLMLGLGGGLLTNHLHCFWPKAQHHVVELRAAVIETAKTFFYMTQEPTIHIHNSDAYAFIENAVDNNDTYSAILIDLYDGESMPDIFGEEDFLRLLHQLKRPDTLLLFNLWASSPESTLNIIRFWEAQPDCKIRMEKTQSTGNLIVSVQ